MGSGLARAAFINVSHTPRVSLGGKFKIVFEAGQTIFPGLSPRGAAQDQFWEHKEQVTDTRTHVVWGPLVLGEPADTLVAKGRHIPWEGVCQSPVVSQQDPRCTSKCRAHLGWAGWSLACRPPGGERTSGGPVVVGRESGGLGPFFLCLRAGPVDVGAFRLVCWGGLDVAL